MDIQRCATIETGDLARIHGGKRRGAAVEAEPGVDPRQTESIKVVDDTGRVSISPQRADLLRRSWNPSAIDINTYGLNHRAFMAAHGERE